jgi:Fe-S cluster assembly protein SufD
MSARPDAPTALARLASCLPGLPGDESWLAWRRAALAALAAAGLPTPRDDAWKYTNLRLLERRDLAPAAPRLLPTSALDELPPPTGMRFVFVDGRLHDGLSSEDWIAGVTLAFADLPHVPPLAPDPAGIAVEDRIRILNAALGRGTDRITIRRGGSGGVPVELVHVSTGGASYPRISIELEAGTSLDLIEYQLGPPTGDAFVASVTDISLAANARLTHTTIQLAGDRAVQLDDVRVAVDRDAHYRHRLVALGGQLARYDLTVALLAPGAQAHLAGLLFADAQREQHVRTLVDHRAPHGTSDQVYRGVAAGRGRGSYDGKVVVRAGAAKTSSRQSSRNLLLSKEAAIDTRPQLEINADDVKCAHGATTGTLDENMLFYLLTRGLDRDTARALLTYAFVEDVLSLLGDGPVRAAVETRALARLPAADTIREFVA